MSNAPPPPLTPFLRPSSVAIIGASDDAARISGRPLRYLRESGFKGAVYPVNPARKTVQGIAAYPMLAAVPATPDVALIVVAANQVKTAIRECAAKGVKSAIVFSAGFAEASDAGRAEQDEIAAIARNAGMRMLGPNCVGLFNSGNGFYGTFTQSMDGGFPKPGPVSVVSQSGAYGADLLFMARERGMGIRYWIATGNEADLTVADGLLWLAQQADVKVIMCYAEGMRDGAAFIRALTLAHENRIPIVFMKSGRSAAGARAAASHTATLAGTDAVYDAVFRQYGVHRARTGAEQLEIAYACAHGVFPAGKRLGIVTISGGGGVQMCDAAERYGLEVPPMPLASQEKLKELLPYAAVGNPCDTTAQVLNDMSLMATNLDIVLAEGGYDALVAFFTTVPASAAGGRLRQAIRDGTAKHAGKLVVLAMTVDPATLQSYRDAGFLAYNDPDRAVEAVAALSRLRRQFDQPLPAAATPPPVDLGTQALCAHDAKKILAQLGIPALPERIAAPAGIEVIIGVRRDPTFGPVVTFGLGGKFVELFTDVSLRVAPFDEAEAGRMLREVKGYALLAGVRGALACDVDAAAKALSRISQFAAANAATLESIDVNPLLVLPAGQGALALDAAIVPATKKPPG